MNETNKTNILEYAKSIKDAIPATLPARNKNKLIKACNELIVEKYFSKKYTGTIQVYSGLSRFDNEPIQIVLSCHSIDSRNKKTGPMIQLSILPMKDPLKVYKSKEESVCGDCKYKGGGCYVAWNRLRKVAKRAEQMIGDLELAKALCYGSRLRVGTAGDPCAVSQYVWEELLPVCDGHTGYTHDWKSKRSQWAKDYFMASCDNLKEVNEALKMNWHPFHVYDVIDGKKEKTHKDSIQCLFREIDASKLQFQSISCFDCMKCNGKTKARTRPITVQLHGATNTLSHARKARGTK